MKTIGVRELHQNTSEWLRCVKAGETLQVTEHGRPVAIITRTPDDETPLERMIRQGRATVARGDLLDVTPAPLIPGLPTMTQMLMEAREHER